MAHSPELLTPAEVAAQLRINYRGVLDLINGGELPGTVNLGGERNGARYRVPQNSVDQFLASRRIPA